MCSTPKESLRTSANRRPPDSSHCGHRTRLHTPPPQTAARSLFTRNRVGEGAPRQSTGTQRRRRGCSECLCLLCCRSRTPVRSPTRPPAPAQCHCLSLWENGGDGGGGRGGGGGGGGGKGRGGGDEAARRHFACGLPPAVASQRRLEDSKLEAVRGTESLYF
ncbi:hypothetical protein H8959_008380 [Pygathrix nigripes]